MKNCIFLLIIFCFLIAACSQKIIDGFVCIDKLPPEIPFHSGDIICKDIANFNELKFAIKYDQKKKGKDQYCIMIQGIDVKKGSLTLIGKTGTVTFLPDKLLSVKFTTKANNFIDSKFKMHSNFLYISTYDSPHLFLRNSLFWIEEFRRDPFEMPLFFKYENDYYFITIPVLKSDDFEGYAGDLVSKGLYYWNED